MDLRAPFLNKSGAQGAIEAGDTKLIAINKFTIFKDMRLDKDSKELKSEECSRHSI